MNRIQISNNLFLDEYFPEKVYNKYKNRTSVLLFMLDKRLIEADQKLRDKFGPVTINNWWNNGDRQYSGLRFPGDPYFSKTSQHSFGRASDKIFKLATAEEVREYIEKNWKDLGITSIEKGVSWVHSDVRFILNQIDLHSYYPK